MHVVVPTLQRRRSPALAHASYVIVLFARRSSRRPLLAGNRLRGCRERPGCRRILRPLRVRGVPRTGAEDRTPPAVKSASARGLPQDGRLLSGLALESREQQSRRADPQGAQWYAIRPMKGDRPSAERNSMCVQHSLQAFPNGDAEFRRGFLDDAEGPASRASAKSPKRERYALLQQARQSITCSVSCLAQAF